MATDKVLENQQPLEESKIKNPESTSEITVEWLKTMLLNVSTSEIISIEVDEKFKPGGHLGKIGKVNINYASEECEPKSVIIKFQKCSEPKREGEIYQLLEDANVFYIPHLYGVFGDGNLVLEDMTSTHSVLKNFTIDQARNVVSLLADVNSRFMDDSRVPRHDLSHFINSIDINMERGWDIFKNRYKKQLRESAVDFEWMWKNREIVSKHYNSGPTILCHGDVNGSNLLFPNDGSDKPILIDWQLSGQKVLPFDLSYFIIKQLTVEQRREYESTLLDEYYKLLPNTIRTNYSFERLVLDYRACVTRSMLSAVTKFGPIFENDPNRFKAADKLATRIIEAVKDLKPAEAIQELERLELLR